VSRSHEELAGVNLIHHLAPKVRHVLLSESDICATTKVLSKRAGKHATVTSVHLLWYFLWTENLGISVQMHGETCLKKETGSNKNLSFA
jgi:hypothetical protein